MWKSVPQEKMRRFVERVPDNIEWVLRCEGIKHKEGSKPPELKQDERECLYRPIDDLLAGRKSFEEDGIDGVDDGQWDLQLADLIGLLRRP